MGNLSDAESFEEMRISMQRAMNAAKKVIREVGREYGKLTGRRQYESLTECYRCEGADHVIVGMGSWMGDAKVAADILWNEGYRVGVVRLRYVRPFPWEEIRQYALSKKTVMVFDRSVSLGHAGPLFLEVSSALESKPSMIGIVAGIGGVPLAPEDFVSIVKKYVGLVEEIGRINMPLVWHHLGSYHAFYKHE